jgi:thiamine biosynthesis protein ThiI
MTDYNAVVVHYAEIALKGENRPYFERILVTNIKESIGKVYTDIKRTFGIIIISLEKNVDLAAVEDCLRKIPGISSYAPAIKVESDVDAIKMQALEIAKNHKKKSFKIETKRSDKSFKLRSLELNENVGSFIVEKTGMKVKLDEPELTIFIEIVCGQVFMYHEKHDTIGGMPIGSAGKLVSLLSGGIDSPVASYFMMKRGVRVIFVHFRNDTQTASKEKIFSLVKVLSGFQHQSILYIVDFKDIQKEIIKNINSRIRMIVYRRMMLRIAETILKKEKARGFITGDSVSQVASQTLENLGVIYQAANYPIFAPLIGMNKQEIVDIGRKIGTYEVSILPYSDCCSFLIAKHPETKAYPNMIEEAEQQMNISELILLAEKNTERHLI